MQKGGYKILNKVVYKFANKARDFINGISTNSLDKGKNAFVDPFGKLVILFDQIVLDDDVYVIFNQEFEQCFLDHLKTYMKFTKTVAEKLDIKVVHVILPNNEIDNNHIGETVSKFDRTIKQEIGFLILTKNEIRNLEKIPDDIYTIIRTENNIPEQGMDFDQEMLLNIYPKAFSNTKGCFLGQEILARVHNIGKPPKKLIRLAYENQPNKDIIITSACYSPKFNKNIGFAIVPRNIQIDNGEIIN